MDINTVLLILVAAITLPALLTAVRLLLPRPVERARQKLEEHQARSFWLGSVNLIFVCVLIGLLAYLTSLHTPVGIVFIILGILICIAFIVVVIPGLAALAETLNQRLGKTDSIFPADLRGGLILVCAGATPYIGWFIFTPLFLSTAFGAILLAFFQRELTEAPLPKA